MESPEQRAERIAAALSSMAGYAEHFKMDTLVMFVRARDGGVYMQVIGDDDLVRDLTVRGMLHVYPTGACANG